MTMPARGNKKRLEMYCPQKVRHLLGAFLC